MIIVCPQCRCKWDRQRVHPQNPQGICRACRWKARNGDRPFFRRLWRTKRDLKNLRYHGECVMCGDPLTHAHDCLIATILKQIQDIEL